MEALFEYLLKVSLALVPFYLVYLLVFKRFTFFALNRYYLLLALATCLAIPFVDSGFLSSFNFIQSIQLSTGLQVENIDISNNKAILTSKGAAKPFNWQLFKTIVYLLGATVTLMLVLKNLYRIRSLIINCIAKKKDHNLTIVYIQGALSSASFFNVVFINNKALTLNDEALIIAHEKLHYQQLHSLDILCIELLKIFFWFNPLIYFYKKSLAEVHEFEVDEMATNKETRKEYASLLLNLAYEQHLSITHSFSVKPLSSRVKMLFKPKTHTMKRFAYLLFFPIAITVAISCQENKEIDNTGPIRTFNVDNENIGKNPLVLIDGKEYSADVLTKIDPEKIQGSTTYEQGYAVKKHGEKAKDGLIELDTRNGSFTFDNEHDRELVIKQIQKELALPKDHFLSKYTYEGRDGKEYEKIICKTSKGSVSSSHISGTKARFFLDGIENSEAEISSLSKDVVEKIKNISVNDAVFNFYTSPPPPPAAPAAFSTPPPPPPMEPKSK
ncbi:M56 family metallopeptidase [Solitalea koreensis]|uniref:Signal transducer regulating beta-lactamase production, contains metallopeptidase domain n=1 Tax=Solitalea koreensis TaxID=543615 RepID=A0A521C3C2_9SPHI|nr:M56 family metallopeptidase [Solitalea koreensis]SMO53899.1 Signal transducer regulating beta-lactamase production, contains metallopeptidase domain [Solitalea koreensis]